MDFTLFKKHPHYHSIFVMKDQETNYAPFNQLRLCCLELKKFNRTESALSGMLDKWPYFLKEAPRLDIYPEVLGWGSGCLRSGTRLVGHPCTGTKGRPRAGPKAWISPGP